MKSLSALIKLMIPALALLAATSTQAAMMLDQTHSTISFVSIKKGTAAEVHTFSNVSGSLSDEGQLTISIDLDSVQTNVDIRNTRMREKLFETISFPSAELSATVSEPISEGQLTPIAVEADLSLHGISQSITVNALALKAGDQLLVTSTQPIIVNAEDFGLDGGIETLRTIAKLPSIALAVPVSFTLVFK